MISSMGKLDELREKADHFEIKKSWQYPLYITLALPALLFLAARLFRGEGMGVTLARLFHTYNLYVSSPLPNLAPFNGTGVLGLILFLGLCTWAVRRKDWTDLGITIALGAVNAVYFWMEWNYLLLRFVNIAGIVTI